MSRNPHKLKTAITLALYTSVLTLLCICTLSIQTLYGQRVYANAQQSGSSGLSSVSNAPRAVDANYTNFSSLNSVVLGSAWQNLQFTGVNKPIASTPLIVNASTSLTLLTNMKVQLTNATALVGSEYAFLSGEHTYAPQNITYDGVRVYIGGVLGGINVYYAFFIVAPRVNNISICTGNQAVLTIQNYQTGYTYKLYEGTTEIAATLNTIAHTLTTTATLTSTKNYHIVALENGTNHPSGRTPVTVTVNPNPSTPNTSLQ